MAAESRAGAERFHHGLWPYVQMARIDHWFKNAFMLLGVILALFVEPSLLRLDVVPVLLLALLYPLVARATTC
jgi:4-hydroxybenzoate polyprenyltransferase